jgi:hypothetical protein
MRTKISSEEKGQIPLDHTLVSVGAVRGPLKRADSDLAYSVHSRRDSANC